MNLLNLFPTRSRLSLLGAGFAVLVLAAVHPAMPRQARTAPTASTWIPPLKQVPTAAPCLVLKRARKPSS